MVPACRLNGESIRIALKVLWALENVLIVYTDGCKHKESCSCGSIAVGQELHFQLLVSVQHQTTLCHLHAHSRLQVLFLSLVDHV